MIDPSDVLLGALVFVLAWWGRHRWDLYVLRRWLREHPEPRGKGYSDHRWGPG